MVFERRKARVRDPGPGEWKGEVVGSCGCTASPGECTPEEELVGEVIRFPCSINIRHPLICSPEFDIPPIIDTN
jgi:hypothetical protein